MILGPKPPPMNGATTRTWRSDNSSMAARPLRTTTGAWVVSHTVSRSALASQSATKPRRQPRPAAPGPARDRPYPAWHGRGGCEEGDMQHPWPFDIVHKQRAAGEQAAVLIARDRGAEITGGHLRRQTCSRP